METCTKFCNYLQAIEGDGTAGGELNATVEAFLGSTMTSAGHGNHFLIWFSDKSAVLLSQKGKAMELETFEKELVGRMLYSLKEEGKVNIEHLARALAGDREAINHMTHELVRYLASLYERAEARHEA